MPKFPLASKGVRFSPRALSSSKSPLRSGEEAGFWQLQGDEVSANILLPCKAPKGSLGARLVLLLRAGVGGAMAAGDRREVKSTVLGSRCCFTTSCNKYVLAVLPIMGQQQNQRGLSRAAFRETAKGAVKLWMEKPSEIICPRQIPHQK